MGVLHTTLNKLFDLLIGAAGAIHPLAGLTVVLPVLAFVALGIFRVTVNAPALQRIKDRIGAYLLEMRIFNDDLRLLLVDPGRILALNVRYLGHTIGPFLLIFPPMLLVIFQIESRYAFRPLDPGESTIVTVAYRSGADVIDTPVILETSSGLAIETPPVRVAGRGETSWRIRATASGRQWVRVAAGEHTIDKLIWVGERPGAISTARSARFAGWGAIAHPAEPPLPRPGIVEEIRLEQPLAEPRGLGLSRSVWIFFLLSTAFGLVFKNVLGVTI